MTIVIHDVHTNHCCLIHGCKYDTNYVECTVVSRKGQQLYLCEWCDEDIKAAERVEKLLIITTLSWP